MGSKASTASGVVNVYGGGSSNSFTFTTVITRFDDSNRITCATSVKSKFNYDNTSYYYSIQYSKDGVNWNTLNGNTNVYPRINSSNQLVIDAKGRIGVQYSNKITESSGHSGWNGYIDTSKTSYGLHRLYFYIRNNQTDSDFADYFIDDNLPDEYRYEYLYFRMNVFVCAYNGNLDCKGWYTAYTSSYIEPPIVAPTDCQAIIYDVNYTDVSIQILNANNCDGVIVHYKKFLLDEDRYLTTDEYTYAKYLIIPIDKLEPGVTYEFIVRFFNKADWYDLTLCATTLESAVLIHDGNKFNSYIPYVYDGEKWRKCYAYVNNNGSWKLSTQIKR